MDTEYLLCVKAVDVQDPHLLDNRTLSGFSSPFDRKTNVRKTIKNKNNGNKDVKTAQDSSVQLSLSLIW